ncbi:MAG TPA: hypothetical protein VMF32_25365 [Xanthobacteraceae bacterium]|nr:hypothetical protein [Xanthobacteraceae bacterium]
MSKAKPGEYRRDHPAEHADREIELPERITVGPDLLKRLLELENAAIFLAREFRQLREQIAKGAT